MTDIIRGNPSIGLAYKPSGGDLLPPNGETVEEIIADLLAKYDAMQVVLEGKADANKLKTLIAYSDEAILLQANDIALVGAVTFLDVWRDQTGQVTGGIHPSLTRIRGGVIQTGIIQSVGYGAATGSSINLDTGTIICGGTTSPKLYFDGATGNLTITGTLTATSIIAGSVTVTGIPGVSTLADLQSSGGLDAAGVNALLAAGVNTVLAGLSGNYRMDAGPSGVVMRHNLAQYNTTIGPYSGALRTALAITANGIAMGYNRLTDGAWINSLVLDSAGNITYSGALNGATGTFAGDVISSGQVRGLGSYTTDGYTAAIVGKPSNTAHTGVLGVSASGIGVVGVSSTNVAIFGATSGGSGIYAVQGFATAASGTAVRGSATGTGGVAISANASGTSGVALEIVAGKITKSNIAGHLLNVYDSTTNTLVGSYRYEFT